MAKRVWRVVRSLTVALAILVAFGFATGARPVFGFAHREFDCGSGYYAQGVGIMDGVYQCVPLAHWPPGVQPPPQSVTTTQEEVGLYLTRLQMRVFHIDFVQGNYEWLAFGVPFSD